MTRSRDTDLSPGGSREVDDLNQVFNATRVKRPLRATSCCAGPIRPGLMLTKTNLGRRLRGRGNLWHIENRFHLSLFSSCLAGILTGKNVMTPTWGSPQCSCATGVMTTWFR